jgi:hypothetical protein
MNTTATAQADRLMLRAEGRQFRYWTLRARRHPRTERAWRRWAAAHYVAMMALQEVGA